MKRIIKHLLVLCTTLTLAGQLVLPAIAADTPIRIAFIDSGISVKHIDPDHVETGKNYVFPESDTSDRIGHGTAAAGLVLGAEDQGVVGVFPDAVAVPLVVVDTYPSGTVKNGGPAALCKAIYDAVDLFHCQIINISLSTPEDSDALQAAAVYAENKGVVVVTVVGNDGENGRTYYPAAYDTVISVGASDGDAVAAFSQNSPDLLTAGVGLRTATNKNSSAAAEVSGTSYSCAVISGICARILSAFPAMTPAETRQCLFGMATDILEPGFDLRSGWGIVDADCTIPCPYWDVPADTWSYPAVCRVTERGIMNGTGAGRFSPDGTMTRAMFAAVLYRMAGGQEVTGKNPFTDVDDDFWYTDAVIWAAGERIIEGYGNGVFGTGDPVTREQMVALFWRYQGMPAADNANLAAFTDSDQISIWAQDAFEWAVSVGVISGKSSGVLDPKGTATRAEVAQILMNFETKFD